MTKVNQQCWDKIQFKSEAAQDSYLSEVRQRVEAYFIKSGTSKHASWGTLLKTVVIFLSIIAIYLCLLQGWFPAIPRLMLWLAFGINQALIAVNIGHDCLHGSYSRFRVVNKLVGFLAYDCIGLNSYIWKQTHNREHHHFTNIAGADPDIDKPGLIRLSPHAPYYPIHRFQHWYVWFLYSLVSINWILFTDYTKFWEYRKKMPKSEVFYFFFFKFINLGLMMIIPLIYFPLAWWEVLLGYVTFQVSGGLTVAIIFQLAHVVENVSFPLPNTEGLIKTSWGEHEMSTTSNFATQDPIVTCVVGGLNFQIEHHLFPKISHCHYPEIATIVRQTAKEYHLPYHEQPTLFAAIASHTRFLKKLGQKNLP